MFRSNTIDNFRDNDWISKYGKINSKENITRRESTHEFNDYDSIVEIRKQKFKEYTLRLLILEARIAAIERATQTNTQIISKLTEEFKKFNTNNGKS